MSDTLEPEDDIIFPWGEWGEEILNELGIDVIDFQKQILGQHLRDILEVMAWKDLSSMLEEEIHRSTLTSVAEQLVVDKGSLSRWLGEGPSRSRISLKHYLAILFYYRAALPPGGIDYNTWVFQLVLALTTRIREQYLSRPTGGRKAYSPTVSEVDFVVLRQWFAHVPLGCLRDPDSVSESTLAGLLKTVTEKVHGMHRNARLRPSQVRDVVSTWSESYVLLRCALECWDDWILIDDESIS